MNTQTQTPQQLTHPLSPAYLWIGNREHIIESTKQWLQKNLCPRSGCGTCNSCQQIAIEQHHAVTWVQPKTSYTLDDLAPIVATIAFALEENQHHFFIITKADLLTPICANSLLKSLEEPPTGYHFILLAQRQDALLPTIQSRCIIETKGAGVGTSQHEKLATFFMRSAPSNPLTFLKALEQTKITEVESVDLINQLFAYWLNKNRQALIDSETKQQQEAKWMVTILKKALLKPPMPGSSNLFWKNLFLQVHVPNP